MKVRIVETKRGFHADIRPEGWRGWLSGWKTLGITSDATGQFLPKRAKTEAEARKFAGNIINLIEGGDR